MKKRSILLSLSAIPLLVACGGGGGGTTAATTTTTQTTKLIGTVPGTKIEAFCDNGKYYTTKSNNNDTNRHPFELDVKKDSSCYIVMTMNEDNPAQRTITMLAFQDASGNESTRIQMTGDIVDLGYVDLPQDPTAMDDNNSDHVKDTPMVIDIPQGATETTTPDTTYDSNQNGTVDVYEDPNHNGTPTAYEDTNNNGTPDIQDDSNHNGTPDIMDSNNDTQNDSSHDDDHDDGGTTDTNTSTGGGTTGGGTTTSNGYILTAWNDLGMHCMDGNDFSVFSVLPPYNNLHAQLKDKNGGLVTSGVTLTYESTTGTDGKINTSSADKTNFWDFSNKLFPNSNLQPDVGLTGKKTPSTIPQSMLFDTQEKWWKAEGLPLTPYNDDGSKNYYPLVKVTAKDTAGNVLATAKVVLPISDEMDCKRCHATNSLSPKAKPNAGWVADTDPEKDFKLNVLRLHDERMPNAVKDHMASLNKKGYTYDAAGLEASARAGTPILCSACHSSNALPGTGVDNIKAFTTAIHSYHAKVIDPYTNLAMNDSTNRGACYACHPGAATKCLRGAMGDSKDANGQNTMQCQSCHGHMSNVGDANRKGWLSEPNCQACHHDGMRETSAIDPATNTLRHVVDTKFATNTNTPMTGVSLYRFSTGHGKLQCEACHGATHAIYPAHNADNILSEGIQGHTGTIGECASCHSSVPNTTTGGPHGMHPVGQSWVSGHKHVAERNAAQCKVCHGQNYRGSALSEMFTTRTLSVEHGNKTLQKDHQVSCYDCHNGPNP